jgi:hypothetical protein
VLAEARGRADGAGVPSIMKESEKEMYRNKSHNYVSGENSPFETKAMLSTRQYCELLYLIKRASDEEYKSAVDARELCVDDSVRSAERDHS